MKEMCKYWYFRHFQTRLQYKSIDCIASNFVSPWEPRIFVIIWQEVVNWIRGGVRSIFWLRLLRKLSAYGLSSKSTNLLGNYLTGRFQQVKIKGVVSSWAGIKKGVPQGSILGPLLFNAFINDIFYFIKEGTLYNYADDNTLSFCHENYDKLVSVLQEESNVLVDWFKDNCMQANPSKFQAIAVGAKTFKKEPVFKIESAEIVCEKSVKLLGIDIDFKDSPGCLFARTFFNEEFLYPLNAWNCMHPNPLFNKFNMWDQDTPDFMEISSHPCLCIYSETCLNRYSIGPKKNIGLDRLSD